MVMGYVRSLLACLLERSASMDGKPRVYQKTSQFAKEMASSYPCGPAAVATTITFKARNTRTRQLEFAHPPAASQVVLVFVGLPQTSAVFVVFRVILPVLLGTVGRPAAVRALESDGAWLGMEDVVRRSTYGARGEGLDSVGSGTNGRDWGL